MILPPRAVRTFFSAIALGVLITSSVPATAQNRRPTPIGDTLKGDAKAAYDKARQLFRAGDYPGSLAELERAQKLSPDPRLFWNMAACEKHLGHPARAMTYVERYLATGGALLTDEERKEGEDFVKAMRTLVASVTITSAVEGVQVFVDGEPAGVTPFSAPIFVDGGEHAIRFTRAGYREASRKETVPAGGTAAWVVELARDTHEGRLVVTAGANDSVWLDGKTVGKGEWGGTVASGEHVVLVTASGRESRELKVRIGDGDVKSLDLHTQERASRTWLWIAGGAVLAAGAAVGGYFLLKPNTPAETPPPAGTLGNYTFQ